MEETPVSSPLPPKPALEGKTALVTGGSRGLGFEIAMAFSEAGAEVIIASRKADACQVAANEISRRTGNRVVPIAAHMGRWAEIERLVERSYEASAAVDILVNNAGMAPLYPNLAAVSEELFDKTVAVNLKGPLRLAALVGERMFSSAGGSIINISSVAGLRPTPKEVVYGAAKAGLHILTLGLALEYGPKVRANTIVAGPFLTDVAKSWDLERFEQRSRLFPLRRGGQPSEIVGAALYFAGNLSTFTTGSMLRVDGGMEIVRV
jgi:NAD(P)-dependent dehydrogenase (short-subunit alcohol dehydrogenase family)